MARGKHGRRADGRRNAQQDAVLRQLEAELAAEQEGLAAAEHALAEVQQLQSDVELERNALADEVAPIAEELRSERDYLRSVLADARAHHCPRVHSTQVQWRRDRRLARYNEDRTNRGLQQRIGRSCLAQRRHLEAQH